MYNINSLTAKTLAIKNITLCVIIEQLFTTYGCLRIAETPNDVFIRKMRPEVWFGFAVKLFKW
jgi:hypothetical protein